MWERNIDWLPPICPQIGDRTHNLLVTGRHSNQLSHTSQGGPSALYLLEPDHVRETEITWQLQLIILFCFFYLPGAKPFMEIFIYGFICSPCLAPKRTWRSLQEFIQHNHMIKKYVNSPGWCGSVDWVPGCEPKGCWFDSWSGHMPGLLARPVPSGGHVRGNHTLMFPSLSPFVPL